MKPGQTPGPCPLPHREATRRRSLAYAVACTAVAALIAFTSLLRPELTDWMASEGGPIQLTQAALLCAACLCLLFTWSRLGLRDPWGPGLSMLSFLAFALAWREIELDNQLWDVHAFSWKYLWDPTVPAAVKWGVGLPSITLTLAVAAYVLRGGAGRLYEALRAWHSPGLRLLALGVMLIVAGQFWDKGRTLAGHFGIEIFLHIDQVSNPLPEETFELVGGMLILCGALEITRLRAPRSATRLSPIFPSALTETPELRT